MKKWLKSLFLVLILAAGLFVFVKISDFLFAPEEPVPAVEVRIAEDGFYDSRDDVALYIHTYNKLPSNFVTKKKAREMGWVASKNNLRKVCKGCSIGGDIFTNEQEILPVKKGIIPQQVDSAEKQDRNDPDDQKLHITHTPESDQHTDKDP